MSLGFIRTAGCHDANSYWIRFSFVPTSTKAKKYSVGDSRLDRLGLWIAAVRSRRQRGAKFHGRFQVGAGGSAA